MKYFKCPQCGYVAHGAGAPEKCPVDGTGKEEFEELGEEEATRAKADFKAREERGQVEQAYTSEEKGRRKDREFSPPGLEADIKQEQEQEQEERKKKKPSAKKQEPPKTLYGAVTAMMARNHAHPIAVHVPNGVVPMAVLFYFIGAVFKQQSFAWAALASLVFVVLAMPAVLYSGYVDWQLRYKGHLTRVIRNKIIAGFVVFGIGIIMVAWLAVMPEVADMGSNIKWAYLFGFIAMLAAVTYAGNLGGRLVFGK